MCVCVCVCVCVLLLLLPLVRACVRACVRARMSVYPPFFVKDFSGTVAPMILKFGTKIR